MKAMLGIFLYIYALLALNSLLPLRLLFNKIRDSAEQALPGSDGEQGREGSLKYPNNYAYLNKRIIKISINIVTEKRDKGITEVVQTSPIKSKALNFIILHNICLQNLIVLLSGKYMDSSITE
jgi:hypothetical protein